jgi:hypothetical protein
MSQAFAKNPASAVAPQVPQDTVAEKNRIAAAFFPAQSQNRNEKEE